MPLYFVESQDPSDVKDYGSLFTLNAGDTIASATVTEVTGDDVPVISSALAISAVAFAAPNLRGESLVSVAIAGGIPGVTYFLWFRVVTALGKVFNRKIGLICEVRVT